MLKITKPQPDRDQTDESLRTERRNADEVMREKIIEAAADAKDLVALARENADAVLSEARDKADHGVETARSQGEAREVIESERAQEDAVVREERRAADEAVRKQRDAEIRALSRLLPLEREKTDRHLVTERVRSDDALASRDDFLGIVSHDVLNLLSGIVLTAEATADNAGDAGVTRANMARVQRYAARMNRLVGDLVDVVSMDAGKLAVHPRESDVGALIAEAMDAFLHTATEKGVALSAEGVAPSLVGVFDPSRLLQVLANLVSNAIKFTPAGGRVSLHAHAQAGALHISVRDSGVGIPTEKLETVFERFWQMTKSEHRGTGLGLYISRCIIEAHGGQIWAESTPGAGSELHLTIPAAVATTVAA